MENNNAIVNQIVTQIGHKWKWLLFIGVALILLGILALYYQFFATLFSIYYIASFIFIAGCLQIAQAFQTKGSGLTFWFGIAGVLYIVAALLMFFNPLFTTVMLTLLLAIALIVTGIIRLWQGFKYRHVVGSFWVMLSALITLLLGIFILVYWPVDSIWIIGIFLGVDLLFQGFACFTLGWELRATDKKPTINE